MMDDYELESTSINLDNFNIEDLFINNFKLEASAT